MFALAAVFFAGGTAYAAAELPASAAWFAPTTAAAGSPITLNALVYNNQKTDATVTVVFSAPGVTIATVTQTIAAQSAMTVSAGWIMPKASAIVTATVTAALDKNKKSLPPLLGVLSTVTVGSMPAPLIQGISFPGSAQLTAWFTPFFNKIETFRKNEAATLTALRDATKAKVTSSLSGAFSHPIDYATLLYSSVGAALFANMAVFYIAAIMIVLLLLRFVVNRIF